MVASRSKTFNSPFPVEMLVPIPVVSSSQFFAFKIPIAFLFDYPFGNFDITFDVMSTFETLISKAG